MKNKLRVIRAERNLTQGELAQMAGISRFSLNSIENGKTTPTIKTIAKISNALSLPAGEIFLDSMLCIHNTEF